MAAARQIRVVVVDDSPVARTFLVRVLKSVPRVRIVGKAKDGLEGYTLVAKLQPDLVLTDIQMPGRDGFQLVQLLRQSHPAIRSIVTSLNDSAYCSATSLQYGADAYIAKHCLLDGFPSLLNRLFPDTSQPSNGGLQ